MHCTAVPCLARHRTASRGIALQCNAKLCSVPVRFFAPFPTALQARTVGLKRKTRFLFTVLLVGEAVNPCSPSRTTHATTRSPSWFFRPAPVRPVCPNRAVSPAVFGGGCFRTSRHRPFPAVACFPAASDASPGLSPSASDRFRLAGTGTPGLPSKPSALATPARGPCSPPSSPSAKTVYVHIHKSQQNFLLIYIRGIRIFLPNNSVFKGALSGPAVRLNRRPFMRDSGSDVLPDASRFAE